MKIINVSYKFHQKKPIETKYIFKQKRVSLKPNFLKSRSCKNPELDKSNLPQISNFGREFVEKSGVQIPVKEGQIFLPLFLFIFKFSIKNCISLFLTIFEYLVLQIKYQ